MHPLKSVQLYLLSLLLSFSSLSTACEGNPAWKKGLVIQPIAGDVILHGAPIEMYFFQSVHCDAACFSKNLNASALKVVTTGKIISINNGAKGGITLLVDHASPDGFSGSVMCASSRSVASLVIPHLTGVNAPFSDLQSKDLSGTSRVLNYKDINPIMFRRVLEFFQNTAKFIEDDHGFQYFTLQNGMEVYVAYDPKSRNQVMTIVYNKRATQ